MLRIKNEEGKYVVILYLTSRQQVNRASLLCFSAEYQYLFNSSLIKHLYSQLQHPGEAICYTSVSTDSIYLLTFIVCKYELFAFGRIL